MLIFRSVLASLLLMLALHSTFAAEIEEWGGSNYVAFDLDPMRLRSDADWQNSAIIKTPACGLQDGFDRVRRDLLDMRRTGQRKIALFLWHLREAHAGNCAGFVLRSNGGHLTSQVQTNLVHFLVLAKELGFDEVQIRFGPKWRNAPKRWESWDESLFEENWSVIRSTVTFIQRTPGPRVVYDLGAELGGLTGPACTQCPEYVRRMWKLFRAEFPNQESYGFSIAYAPGRLGRLIDVLSATGNLPSYFALDLYGDPASYRNTFSRLSAEARSSGIGSLRLLIQETWYADPEAYHALLGAARSSKIAIKAVMQWPRERGNSLRQISVPATPRYIYGPPR